MKIIYPSQQLMLIILTDIDLKELGAKVEFYFWIVTCQTALFSGMTPSSRNIVFWKMIQIGCSNKARFHLDCVAHVERAPHSINNSGKNDEYWNKIPWLAIEAGAPCAPRRRDVLRTWALPFFNKKNQVIAKHKS